MFLAGNFALKPLQIGEIMSNNKIMHFSYSSLRENDLTMESAMTAILRDSSGKMHHGILVDCCLHFDQTACKIC